MTNLMCLPANNIDVHGTVSGRKARIALSEDNMQLYFGKSEAPVSIDWTNFDHAAHNGNRVGLSLSTPMCVIPNTRKPTTSVVVKLSEDAAELDKVHEFITNHVHSLVITPDTQSITTVSNNAVVYLLNNDDQFTSVVVWEERKCSLVSCVKGVVLQRTTGGMTTYDAHIVPTLGDVVTVEMLPHSTMLQWPDTMGDDNVIDAGADPVPLEVVQESQEAPTLKEYFADYLGESDSMAESSAEESEWDGSNSSDEESEISMFSVSSDEADDSC